MVVFFSFFLKCVFLARGKFESFQRNLDDNLENNMFKTFKFKNNLCFSGAGDKSVARACSLSLIQPAVF